MTASREVYNIIVTLLQLYDETSKNLQHQYTMHHSNKSTSGTTRLNMEKKWTSLKMVPHDTSVKHEREELIELRLTTTSNRIPCTYHKQEEHTKVNKGPKWPIKIPRAIPTREDSKS
jgi:hypothetical protein